MSSSPRKALGGVFYHIDTNMPPIIRADGVIGSTARNQRASGGSIPTSALSLRIEEIPVDLTMTLNEKWHSVLPITVKSNLIRNRYAVFYGASYESIHYATAIWTSPVARQLDINTTIELRRFAISPEAPPNTASRLLAIMTKLITRKFPNVLRLVSYQAVDCHDGTIYKAAGWKPMYRTKYASWGVSRSRAVSQIQSDKVMWQKVVRYLEFGKPPPVRKVF